MNAFTALLTVESLLFAGMGVLLTLSGPQGFLRQGTLELTTLGRWFASLITVVALALILIWSSLFAEDWPCDFRGAIVALVFLAVIVVEAVFAWILARALGRAGTLPPKNPPSR